MFDQEFYKYYCDIEQVVPFSYKKYKILEFLSKVVMWIFIGVFTLIVFFIYLTITSIKTLPKEILKINIIYVVIASVIGICLVLLIFLIYSKLLSKYSSQLSVRDNIDLIFTLLQKNELDKIPELVNNVLQLSEDDNRLSIMSGRLLVLVFIVDMFNGYNVEFCIENIEKIIGAFSMFSISFLLLKVAQSKVYELKGEFDSAINSYEKIYIEHPSFMYAKERSEFLKELREKNLSSSIKCNDESLP